MQEQKEIAMKVSREVILDLLPLYTAGEASPATCALVEEYLRQDADLRVQVQRGSVKELMAVPASEAKIPADLEMRSLRRTRSLLRWQRRTYGWGLALSIISLSGAGYLQNGHPVFHFFMRDYPQFFVPCLSLAISCWVNYFVILWRLRSTRL
jgi:hypothetical protein